MTHDDFKAWAQALQVGDKLAVNTGSYGTARYGVGVVARLTATQAIVQTFYEREQRFRREDGREVGGGTSYSRTTTIEPLTQDIRNAIEKAKLNEWIAGLTRHHQSALSLRVMRAMRKAHDSEAASEAAGPQWPEDKFDQRQREWCIRYERETTFEPQMDDYLAGNETFVQAAEKAVQWFHDHSTDALHRATDGPIPGSEFDFEGSPA